MYSEYRPNFLSFACRHSSFVLSRSPRVPSRWQRPQQRPHRRFRPACDTSPTASSRRLPPSPPSSPPRVPLARARTPSLTRNAPPSSSLSLPLSLSLSSPFSLSRTRRRILPLAVAPGPPVRSFAPSLPFPSRAPLRAPSFPRPVRAARTVPRRRREYLNASRCHTSNRPRFALLPDHSTCRAPVPTRVPTPPSSSVASNALNPAPYSTRSTVALPPSAPPSRAHAPLALYSLRTLCRHQT